MFFPSSSSSIPTPFLHPTRLYGLPLSGCILTVGRVRSLWRSDGAQVIDWEQWVSFVWADNSEKSLKGYFWRETGLSPEDTELRMQRSPAHAPDFVCQCRKDLRSRKMDWVMVLPSRILEYSVVGDIHEQKQQVKRKAWVKVYSGGFMFKHV